MCVCVCQVWALFGGPLFNQISSGPFGKIVEQLVIVI